MEKIQTEIVVLGGGPGGCAAAFYAADKGKKVILVEQEKRLGGVCLNRGCIPSKALLYATHLIEEARASVLRGIEFGQPKIDMAKLRAWKESILEKLGQGISMMAKRRAVEVMAGRGTFVDSQTLRVETGEGAKLIQYEKAIIAAGSKAALPQVFNLGDPQVMTSTEALNLEEIPQDLLVIGGGYIGMELGTVYATLGSRVVLVEALESILSGADADLVRPVKDYAEKHFKEVRVSAKVLKMEMNGKKVRVEIEIAGEKKEESYDRVLVSVGRVPDCENLGLEHTKVTRDKRGYILVNGRQETTDAGIYAIGDAVGGVMLAHKAAKEARVAVEVITGESGTFEGVVIPAVVFTDPEIAWCGLTEADAKIKGIDIQVTKFPWAASGRAVTMDRTEGMTKLIIEPKTERVLGVGIVGHGAGELIGEAVLAIEMGATVKNLARTVHPHPTLSETIMECAELFYGYATHAYVRRRGGNK
ncbi:MAG: dihydrolipoyl dehydrogenase [Candidatus Omnitrophica bacterium]|nr:dihydrolipoyl dehydrogenase [Candidatus Omnitrophota bacterium]MDD5671518.1 dihydrolipoyl dehydrogenase [Candidatus Omnitrophota bacterium]